GTIEQAFLTNHKPGPHVRRPPSESPTLATRFTIFCTSFKSFSGWLPIFLACHCDTGHITSQSDTSGVFHPNPPHWSRRSIYKAPHTCLSMVGCITTLHAIGTQIDTGLAEVSVVQYVRALIRRHTTPQ
uniref:Secreted protein n=1 Tax=Mesocestoides corti TaxID=53468 RepID=A0A5K3FHW8_MESCO